jgi:hypothetical protein
MQKYGFRILILGIVSCCCLKFGYHSFHLSLVIEYSIRKQRILRSYIKWRFFVVAALLIKAKQQHGINQNKNTGLFINCMDFVVVRTKINKHLLNIFRKESSSYHLIYRVECGKCWTGTCMESVILLPQTYFQTLRFLI